MVVVLVLLVVAFFAASFTNPAGEAVRLADIFSYKNVDQEASSTSSTSRFAGGVFCGCPVGPGPGVSYSRNNCDDPGMSNREACMAGWCAGTRTLNLRGDETVSDPFPEMHCRTYTMACDCPKKIEVLAGLVALEYVYHTCTRTKGCQNFLDNRCARVSNSCEYECVNPGPPRETYRTTKGNCRIVTRPA